MTIMQHNNLVHSNDVINNKTFNSKHNKVINQNID